MIHFIVKAHMKYNSYLYVMAVENKVENSDARPVFSQLTHSRRWSLSSQTPWLQNCGHGQQD